jgi:ABC-2 type transport system ATP-binding protein
MSLINVQNVFKKYSNTTVLDNISFSISSGECIVLIGKNGAGKTTLINLLTGNTQPNCGKVFINNNNPQHYKSRHIIGCTPQVTEFPEELTVQEILQFIAAHYPRQESIDYLLQQFDLENFAQHKACKLSGGQRRRLALALAFAGKPKIVFLDEPTTSLDVESQRKFWQYISAYIINGGTVFLSSHNLEEIETLATRVLYLNNHHIQLNQNINAFKKRIQQTVVSFESMDQLIIEQKYQKIGNQYRFYTNQPEYLISTLVQNNTKISNLEVKQCCIYDCIFNKETI